MAPIFLPICVFATVVRFIALFLNVATNLPPWFEFRGIGGNLSVSRANVR